MDPWDQQRPSSGLSPVAQQVRRHNQAAAGRFQPASLDTRAPSTKQRLALHRFRAGAGWLAQQSQSFLLAVQPWQVIYSIYRLSFNRK